MAQLQGGAPWSGYLSFLNLSFLVFKTSRVGCYSLQDTSCSKTAEHEAHTSESPWLCQVLAVWRMDFVFESATFGTKVGDGAKRCHVWSQMKVTRN